MYLNLNQLIELVILSFEAGALFVVILLLILSK
jgi:hypothetical protein